MESVTACKHSVVGYRERPQSRRVVGGTFAMALRDGRSHKVRFAVIVGKSECVSLDHPAKSDSTYSLTHTYAVLYRGRSHNVRASTVQYNSRREDGIARLK